MAKDVYDYLNAAEFNLRMAACLMAVQGDGEDAEFEDCYATLVEHLGKRGGVPMVRAYVINWDRYWHKGMAAWFQEWRAARSAASR